MSCCTRILTASRTVTKCACLGDGPVKCRLHDCQKNAHFHSLCQRDPRYFELWQEGRGPGQVSTAPSPLPLGTWAAAAIKLVTFGKIVPCDGCKGRAAALNRFGAWLYRLWRKLARQ